MPADKLLSETDSPYLAPQPVRGQRNEPAHILDVLRRIAALRGESETSVAAATTANVHRLFDLDRRAS